MYNGRMPLTPRLKEMNGVIEEEDFDEAPTSADDVKKTISRHFLLSTCSLGFFTVFEEKY